MKKYWVYLLLLAFVAPIFGCDKADYEEKAEQTAKQRAERNRADHDKRSSD